MRHLTVRFLGIFVIYIYYYAYIDCLCKKGVIINHFVVRSYCNFIRDFKFM